MGKINSSMQFRMEPSCGSFYSHFKTPRSKFYSHK